MQTSPFEGFAQVNELLSIIQQGTKEHRCRISRGVMTFTNPLVENINQAVSLFKNSPSPDNFLAIKEAVGACESKEVKNYDYEKINELITEISKASESYKISFQNKKRI